MPDITALMNRPDYHAFLEKLRSAVAQDCGICGRVGFGGLQPDANCTVDCPAYRLQVVVERKAADLNA
ncbi:MAG: hypothetical protein HOB37_09745 [Rhodospirillaceae bacterium]|nr:hypothetical protein [Rhodospirillaceae bacterium]